MSDSSTQQKASSAKPSGKITDEGVAEMQAQIGVKQKVQAWNHYVTFDNIWHFASGIGDDNPMWWDEEYAKKTVWGTMIAPPTYLYSHMSGPMRLADAIRGDAE